MKRIAVDFHSVLAEITQKWLELVYGTNTLLTPKDVTCWNTWECLPHSKEDFWEAIETINGTDRTVYLPPVPGAVAGFRECVYTYPTTRILTAVPPVTIPFIEDWLRRNGLPVVPVENVGTNGYNKFDFPFDIYVDDNPNMVGNTPENKWLILYDQPWNQHVEPNNVNEHRVHSWTETIRKLNEIQNIL